MAAATPPKNRRRESGCLTSMNPPIGSGIVRGKVTRSAARMVSIPRPADGPPRGYNQGMTSSLTPRQRAQLKARAHALEPVVQVGQAGLSEAVAAELERALTAHELIKVRIAAADRDARAELAEAICARTGAAKVQSVGKILVLYRPRPDEAEGD